jgi:DNA ligase (NAD+)
LPKLDGISITLYYKNRKLIAAYKRGDGKEGEDCLVNAQYIQGVLPELKQCNNWPNSGDIYVRGEVICHNKIFKKSFAKEAGGKYSAVRNFVGGLLNTLPNKSNKLPDDTIIGLQACTFVCFSLEHFDKGHPVIYSNSANQIGAMSNWGFTTIINPSRYNKKAHRWFDRRSQVDWNKYKPVLKTDNIVPDWVVPFDAKLDEEYFSAKFKQYAEAVDIDQDGLVLEAADFHAKQSLGYMPNGKTPKFAIAVKPDIEDQLTIVGTVKTITLKYSSRRIFTPVLNLEKPLNFKGVKVSNITGHNVGNLIKLGVDIGSKVKIIRSGDVIPRLVGIADKKRTNLSWLITKCVYCNTKLVYTRDNKTNKKVHLHCPNKKCHGFGIETLNRFFSKSKFKIDGLSRGTLENMAKVGIDTVPKVLRVTPKQLAKVEGFAEKKAANILAGIKKVTASADLAVIAGASGIFANEKHGLDAGLLKPIVTKLGKYQFLGISENKLLRSKLIGVPNMGTERIELFLEKLPEFQKFYAEISDLITLDTSKIKLSSTKFAGKTFVFTEYRNKELENYIVTNGGKVANNVSSKTTAVFFGKPGSKKYNNAKEKGVPVVPAEKAENFLLKYK